MVDEIQKKLLEAERIGYQKGFADGYEKAKKETNRPGMVKPLFQ